VKSSSTWIPDVCPSLLILEVEGLIPLRSRRYGHFFLTTSRSRTHFSDHRCYHTHRTFAPTTTRDHWRNRKSNQISCTNSDSKGANMWIYSARGEYSLSMILTWRDVFCMLWFFRVIYIWWNVMNKQIADMNMLVPFLILTRITSNHWLRSWTLPKIWRAWRTYMHCVV
jgi:hypothetical protein